MDPRVRTMPSYLGNGLYAIQDAAAILCVPTARLRHWVHGYYYASTLMQKHQVPVVPRFYGREDSPLSFVELIELLFVARFRRSGLSMQYIRKAARKARQQFDTPYPFAVQRFSTDGRQIFATIDTEEHHKTATHEILYGQVIFDKIVKPHFKWHIDVEQDLAKRYWPLGRKKRIVLDAERAFGAPIDAETGVPTEALASAVDAGDSPQDVAEWFNVPIKAVRAALTYEHHRLAA